MSPERPITAQDLSDSIIASIDALTQHGVQYVLIGGMATGYRSQPRFTKDVDLLLHIPQLTLPARLETLRQRGFQFDPATVSGTRIGAGWTRVGFDLIRHL